MKALDHRRINLDENDRNDPNTFMSKHIDNTYNEYQLKWYEKSDWYYYRI